MQFLLYIVTCLCQLQSFMLRDCSRHPVIIDYDDSLGYFFVSILMSKQVLLQCQDSVDIVIWSWMLVVVVVLTNSTKQHLERSNFTVICVHHVCFFIGNSVALKINIVNVFSSQGCAFRMSLQYISELILWLLTWCRWKFSSCLLLVGLLCCYYVETDWVFSTKMSQRCVLFCTRIIFPCFSS